MLAFPWLLLFVLLLIGPKQAGPWARACCLGRGCVVRQMFLPLACSVQKHPACAWYMQLLWWGCTDPRDTFSMLCPFTLMAVILGLGGQ